MATHYETLSEATNDLFKRGYRYDFNKLEPAKGDFLQNGVNLKPDEFQIDETYRFEGMTNPEDESIVYAISSAKHGLKGILVNAFGPTADRRAADLVAKLKDAAT